MKCSNALVLIVKTFLSILSVLNCDATTVDEDLNLNHQQKLNLDKFKDSVVSKLPHDWMKQDVYLIRWLRARNFNPEQAEEFLMNNIKWREENQIDDILNQTWSDMTEYAYSMDTHTKEGKPILVIDLGRWDLRSADLTGRFDRLVRYGERIMEEEETLIRRLQSQGQLVTRTVLILDMDGFNLQQHFCSRCFSYILGFYESFEKHYPLLVDKMFIINNHPIVNTVLQALLNNMAPHTKQIVRLYNRNKAEYSKALLETIAADQLPERYGGTKKDS